MPEVPRSITWPDGCSHGVGWDAPCIECEKINLRQTIKSFEPMVENAKKRLAELEGWNEQEEEHRVA